MGPVVGLDVSKGSSMLQAFTERNKPYGKIVSILHTAEGFKQMGGLLENLKELTGLEPVVVMEATGHYHRSPACVLGTRRVSPLHCEPFAIKAR